MQINHNLTAMNTLRQLNTASTGQAKSMEKLSSGLRINRAGDDAAGLAISEKMRGQIRGLDQASRNAQDGISLIATAEGALNETHDILQRMRELSVQATNDTLNDSDRGEIQKEMNQLIQETDRIGNNTEFNTKNLINGQSGKNALNTASTATGNLVQVQKTGELAIGGTYQGIEVDTTATKTAVDNSGTAVATVTSAGATNLVLNGVDFKFAQNATAADMAAAINEKSAAIGFTATDAAGQLTFQANDYGAGYTLTATGTASGVVGSETTGVNATVSTGLPAGVTAVIDDSKHGAVVRLQGGSLDGVVLNTAGTADGDTFELTVADKSLKFQIGANENQTMSVSIQDMRAGALGVNNIDVSNSTNASASITKINTAIETVSAERSKLGAYQNRLEHTINNLGTSSENLTAAESRVRDVDMAKEMMNQTKNSILSQAAQAMLAQANQMPQGVLQLLR
ncbi:flagellin N-terminal helical domain-containing protein [Neobacillus drentensis]|uniref:flagellin N-terminal helical domain-containing protein n=1 Tax=Neobacillus drentensis TaxID=220684 RepID=UPI0028663F47|nr:flagellin [Neobacillus drentensis]MDR7235692.1 flagellin [Neobacillus drentensis]